MPAIARAFFTLVTLTRSGRVQSILAIAIQEMTGCFRASPLNMTKTQVALVTHTHACHPDAKRKGPVKSCITQKRPVRFARDACCWSVDVLFFLFIS